MKAINYILAVTCLGFAVMTFITRTDVSWLTGGVLWLYMAMGNFAQGNGR